MIRYFRLYLYFLRFSFSKALEFRLDFYFRVFMDMIYYTVNIVFYKIIYNQTSLLAGWTEAQVMVFVGIYLVVDALNMTVFSNNLWWFPQYVNKGDIDYYLVRPISTLFFLSLREFAANSFMNLVLATGILAWTIHLYPEPFSLSQYFMLAALIVNGTFLYFFTYMVFLIPVFWTHTAHGFRQVFFTFSRVYERPDRIFTGAVRLLLTTVLPFSVVASFPARLFLEGFHLGVFLHICAATVGFFGIMLGLWKFGCRSYSSASS